LGRGETFDWDELIAVACDGDLSQYDVVVHKRTLRQIAVFLKYRAQKYKVSEQETPLSLRDISP